jgi:hypothetical protein
LDGFSVERLMNFLNALGPGRRNRDPQGSRKKGTQNPRNCGLS